jgi:hypothetical protein
MHWSDTMPVTEADIYKLTAKGSNELKGGATGLTPRELELIVLIDGRRQVSAITKLATIGDPAEIGGLLENRWARDTSPLPRRWREFGLPPAHPRRRAESRSP